MELILRKRSTGVLGVKAHQKGLKRENGRERNWKQ